jgi:hypothetical protein
MGIVSANVLSCQVLPDMAHRLVNASGYLTITGAAKHEDQVGCLAVVLALNVEPVVTLSDGTPDREMQRALAQSNGALSSSVTSIPLQLTLSQAYQLLSELEDLHAKFLAADQ